MICEQVLPSLSLSFPICKMRINTVPLTGLWGHQRRPAQCLAPSGHSINLLSFSPPSGSQMEGAQPVTLNYANDVQVVEEG